MDFHDVDECTTLEHLYQDSYDNDGELQNSLEFNIIIVIIDISIEIYLYTIRCEEQTNARVIDDDEESVWYESRDLCDSQSRPDD